MQVLYNISTVFFITIFSVIYWTKGGKEANSSVPQKAKCSGLQACLKAMACQNGDQGDSINSPGYTFEPGKKWDCNGYEKC